MGVRVHICPHKDKVMLMHSKVVNTLRLLSLELLQQSRDSP